MRITASVTAITTGACATCGRVHRRRWLRLGLAGLAAIAGVFALAYVLSSRNPLTWGLHGRWLTPERAIALTFAVVFATTHRLLAWRAHARWLRERDLPAARLVTP